MRLLSERPRLGDLGGDITLIFVIWVSERGLGVGAKPPIPREKSGCLFASLYFEHFIQAFNSCSLSCLSLCLSCLSLLLRVAC